MPKYLYSGNYTAEGAAGLLRESGTARHEEARKIVTSMGGNLEAYYWCYGEKDFLMILDIPSESMAIKFSLAIGAWGGFQGKLTPIITVEQMDQAISTDLPEMRLQGE